MNITHLLRLRRFTLRLWNDAEGQRAESEHHER